MSTSPSTVPEPDDAAPLPDDRAPAVDPTAAPSQADGPAEPGQEAPERRRLGTPTIVRAVAAVVLLGSAFGITASLRAAVGAGAVGFDPGWRFGDTASFVDYGGAAHDAPTWCAWLVVAVLLKQLLRRNPAGRLSGRATGFVVTIDIALFVGMAVLVSHATALTGNAWTAYCVIAVAGALGAGLFPALELLRRRPPSVRRGSLAHRSLRWAAAVCAVVLGTAGAGAVAHASVPVHGSLAPYITWAARVVGDDGNLAIEKGTGGACRVKSRLKGQGSLVDSTPSTTASGLLVEYTHWDSQLNEHLLLAVLDPATGKEKWHLELPKDTSDDVFARPTWNPALHVDDTSFVVSPDGTRIVVRLEPIEPGDTSHPAMTPVAVLNASTGAVVRTAEVSGCGLAMVVTKDAAAIETSNELDSIGECASSPSVSEGATVHEIPLAAGGAVTSWTTADRILVGATRTRILATNEAGTEVDAYLPRAAGGQKGEPVTFSGFDSVLPGGWILRQGTTGEGSKALLLDVDRAIAAKGAQAEEMTASAGTPEQQLSSGAASASIIGATSWAAARTTSSSSGRALEVMWQDWSRAQHPLTLTKASAWLWPDGTVHSAPPARWSTGSDDGTLVLAPAGSSWGLTKEK